MIRLVALLDRNGKLRLERGAAHKAAVSKKSSHKTSRGGNDLQLFDLSHDWGHGMPQWPSRANLNVRTLEFHAKDGLLVQQFEGIMHRGTHMDAPIHVAENQPTLTGYPLWRFFGTRRRGVDSERQMGRHHAKGSTAGGAEDREE